MKNKYQINLADYTKNAAKHFSFLKLIIFIVVSLALTAALVYSCVKEKYQGIALIFTSIAFIMIAGYAILNIMALFRKLKETK